MRGIGPRDLCTFIVEILEQRIGSQLNSDFDAIIMGSGFAGLSSGLRLSRLGYRVLIVDSAAHTLAGTSSRNEGWLHAGTYHALSIVDRVEAMSVANRCRYGWEQFQLIAPECVEPEPHPAVAVVSRADSDRAADRWDEARVHYQPASPALLRAISPDVRIRGDENVFEVADRAINVRVLAARLLAEFRRYGGELLLGTTLRRQSEDQLIATGAYQGTLRFRLLICATGYATPQACRDLGVTPPQLRFWRSHLMTIPRLAAASTFGVAGGQAAMINHGRWSVVGLNEDASLVSEPTFEPDPEVAGRLREAVADRFPGSPVEDAMITACVKVDLVDTPDDPRSLNVRISRLDNRVYSVLPGKMTESIFTADRVVALTVDLLGLPGVQRRPLDGLAHVDLKSPVPML